MVAMGTIFRKMEKEHRKPSGLSELRKRNLGCVLLGNLGEIWEKSPGFI